MPGTVNRGCSETLGYLPGLVRNALVMSDHRIVMTEYYRGCTECFWLL
jgi:hypothetical protein